MERQIQPIGVPTNDVLKKQTAGLTKKVQAAYKELQGTELATQTIQTIRTRLIKIGAQVHETARRVWFRCASNHPYRSLYESISQKVLAYT